MIFTYVALEGGERTKTGSIDAEDEAAAAKDLARQGMVVLALAPRNRLEAIRAILTADITLSPRLGAKDHAGLVQEWATFLDAGIQLHAALQFSTAGRRGRARRSAVLIAEEVRSGASFQRALERSQVFPPEFVAVVGAAEASGTLAATLRREATAAEASLKRRQDLIAGLVYPVILTVAALAAVGVLLVVVVPNLDLLVSGTEDRQLPAVTQWLIGTSRFLRQHGATAVLAAAAVLLVPLVFFATPRGRADLDRMILGLPIVGRMVSDADLCRYLHTLGNLLAGNLGLARSLRLAAPTVRNRTIARRLAGIQEAVSHGESLSASLGRQRLLSADALGLLRSGEESGRLGDMCAAAARLPLARADQRRRVIMAASGPALTVIFGLLAGTIVYAMMTTILSINDAALR